MNEYKIIQNISVPRPEGYMSVYNQVFKSAFPLISQCVFVVYHWSSYVVKSVVFLVPSTTISTNFCCL